MTQPATSVDTIITQNCNRIFNRNWGAGQPTVFHHNWPLSNDNWDSQMLLFLAQGYRVIAHDRRGHGERHRWSTVTCRTACPRGIRIPSTRNCPPSFAADPLVPAARFPLHT
jgi:pimeloyl-ACP methyl ester carboxylesterase